MAVCEAMCAHVDGGGGGWKEREPPRGGCIMWVCPCGGRCVCWSGGGGGCGGPCFHLLICSCSRRQDPHGGSLPSWTWDGHLQPPDACSSIDTLRLTSTHTLAGLFAQPRGAAVLRTWYGIYKKIFVNGGRSAVRNGPVQAADSHPAIFWEEEEEEDEGQGMRAPDAWRGPLLSHPVSQHVLPATLNHSTTDKLTAPSLTATEMKSQRTLMTESALKTLSHISFQAACASDAAADVRLWNFQ